MTTAAELGYAPVFLPNGEQVWVARPGAITKASYGSQAVAVRSLADEAKAASAFGVADTVLGPGLPPFPAHQGSGQPRRWSYTPGYNIANLPRQYETYSYSTLRQLTDTYDVARLCIEERKARIRRLNWHIQAKPVADMPRLEAKARTADLAANVQRVTGFFLSPDQATDFSSWLMEWLELTFSIDAACIFRRPTNGGGFYGLDIVDGATIKIIVDEYGSVPRPPVPAYDQVLFGTVWSQYTTDEMLFRPYWMRPDSPYGSPPIEWVVLAVNRALRRQTLDLSLYTDGNVPVGFMKVAENIPAAQISEMQTFFDELLAGNDTSRSRIRFVPGGPGTGLEQLNPQPTTEAEEALAILTCAAFGVEPKALGFMGRHSAGLGGKGMVEGIETAGIERDAEICDYVARTLNQVIAQDLGEPELEFVFDGLEQAEDQLSKAQAEDVRLRNGSLALDEAREDHDLDPIGVNIPFVVAGQTIVLATDIAALSGKEVTAAPPPVPFGSPAGPAAPAGDASAQPGAKADLPTASSEPGKATTTSSDMKAAKAAADELRAWRTKAIRKGAGAPFEAHAIPPAIVTEIRKGLAATTDAEAIRELFAGYAKAGGASADPFPSPRAGLMSSAASASSSPASSPTRPTTSRSGWAL